MRRRTSRLPIVATRATILTRTAWFGTFAGVPAIGTATHGLPLRLSLATCPRPLRTSTAGPRTPARLVTLRHCAIDRRGQDTRHTILRSHLRASAITATTCRLVAATRLRTISIDILSARACLTTGSIAPLPWLSGRAARLTTGLPLCLAARARVFRSALAIAVGIFA